MINEVLGMLLVFLVSLNISGFFVVSYLPTIDTKLQESEQQITHNCHNWEFQCQNGNCISEIFLCDGLLDCADGTDETYSLCRNKTCDEQHFQCHYGACIEKNYHCDGKKQCWDGSDELPQSCSETNTNIMPIRMKRNVDGSCAAPAPSVDKDVAFLCRNKSQSCQPKNGYVPERTRALVTCKRGYDREEEEFPDHICNFDATWRPSIKKCLKICEKLDPPNVIMQCYRNGQSINNCTENTVLLAGSKIRPSCKPTYAYEFLPSYSEIICNENGKWDKPLIECVAECGKFSGRGLPRIAGGKRESPGNSPWHVAIFKKQDTLICGGTLIHKLLVVTAAHCFNEIDVPGPVNVDDYEVVVAKYTRNYTTKDNKFQKTFKIKEIRYSSDIGYLGIINNHQSDIAIIILKEKITTSPTVLPACVNWMDLKNRKRPSDGQLGKVVGWGETEYGKLSEELKTIDLPVIDFDRCIKMVHKDFIKFITLDKFCAGIGNKTGPILLKGDSGGGILFKENGLYYLRGIVSVKDKISNSIALFTDLASHIDTIVRIRDEIESNAYPSTNTTAAGPRPRTAVDIALQKCKEFAEYRYVNKWKNSTTLGQNGSWQKEMDCVNVVPLIFGGTAAEPKEYPHMALIGFGDSIENVDWLCGGSLISEKFVMSAAQCSESSYGTPRWVLLGTTDKTLKDAHSKPAVYQIVKSHVHPSYKQEKIGVLDIVLFELNTTVTISPYVRPACLYPSTYIPVNTTAKITGWGLINTGERRSYNLMKATISIYDDEICKTGYNASTWDFEYDSKSMICAGDLVGGKNTCDYDNGGPLQIPVDNEVCMWNVLGVSSYGSAYCGSREIPSVYTRVPYFLNWIQSIVWP